MSRAKIKKKSTFIDMTAMSDVTVLLLTFFMLTSTFVKKEPVQVTTPASVSEIKIPETNVLQILVDPNGKVFMSLDKQFDLRNVLEAMGALRYNFDLIFANLLFGANFSFYVSLTRNYLDFQQIFMLQVLAASIFFIPFALFSKQSYRIPLRDFGNILIVTVLIVYGWMFMLLWGASYTSPIDASTISTLGPVFTILTGHFLLREKNITWARRIGVVLGFAGAAFLLFDKGFRLAPGSSGLGNALVLVAVVAIAVNTVIIKPQLQRYGTLVVMGWYYIIGLLITAPFFWKYIADTDFLRLPLSGQAELAYVLVLGTVLPMYLLYRGTEKLTFIHTALYRYIQPVVATVLALVRHQEQIDRTNIIAGVLIFASIILVIREANLRGFFSSVQAPSPTPDGRSRKRP